MDMRYDRQQLIPSWDQSALAASHVVIIGAGALGAFTALGLAALGVGDLTLIDDAPLTSADWFHRLVTPAASRAQALAAFLARVNPQVKARGMRTRLLYEASFALIPHCRALVETSGDPQSQAVARAYGRAKSVPVIVATGNGTRAGYRLYRPGDAECAETDCAGEAGPLPALAVGALIQDEVRRCLLPLGEADVPAAPGLQYDLAWPARFVAGAAQGTQAVDFGGRYHALVVGAGALGTYVALGLALRGIGRLTIVDPDRVEETNLNRQVLFYDAVGEPKARVLAERVRQCCPEITARGLAGRVTWRHLREKVDILCACVDNFATRAWLNRVARARGLPLINGGTTPFEGEVEVYVPGRTACLECAVGVSALAAEERGRQRCAHAPEPSTVIANQLAGGWMAAEAGPALDPATWGPPLQGVLAYDAFTGRKVGVRSVRAACDCHQASGNRQRAAGNGQ